MRFTVLEDFCCLIAPEAQEDIPISIRSERAMWRAVIVQSLMDAASRSRKAEAIYHKNEAIAWLTGGSKDFLMVCEYAGFDAHYVRRMAKRALLSGCRWRAEPGQGRRRSRSKAEPTPPEEDCPAMVIPFPAAAERCFA